MATEYSAILDGGTTPMLKSYPNFAALDAVSELNLMDGALSLVLDTRTFYQYKNGTGWVACADDARIAVGEFTWTGGAATANATISGVVSTDKVLATVKSKGATNFLAVGATAGAGQVTFQVGGPVPGNDVVVAYAIYRDLTV